MNLGRVFCGMVMAVAVHCGAAAYAADNNIIMPFRASRLSNWDGTAVDEKCTLGQLLDRFQEKYFRKIRYETPKTDNGAVTLVVQCVVDFDKFPYARELRNRYDEIRYVVVFVQQADLIMTSGAGNYRTGKDGTSAGGMEWSFPTVQEAVGAIAGKVEYVPDSELARAFRPAR